MTEVGFVASAAAFAAPRVTIRTATDAGRARERDLVLRAQGGEVAAFETLYRENVRRIYALSFRLERNPQRAEELTQDAFVRAWNKLDSFRGDSAFASWMHTLTTNLSLSDRRSRVRRGAREFATDDLEPLAAVEPGRPEVGVDLERALQRLPRGARQVFVLHDIEGYKHGEIATQMGVAVGTSKAQLHRARKLLREALEG